MGPRAVDWDVAGASGLSLLATSDVRGRVGRRRNTLRRLAITRRILGCLCQSARKNPGVANFATPGFKWCERDPLRKENRDISKTIQTVDRASAGPLPITEEDRTRMRIAIPGSARPEAIGCRSRIFRRVSFLQDLPAGGGTIPFRLPQKAGRGVNVQAVGSSY